MQIDQCFFLGSIVKKHGYKGSVVVKFDTDQPENYRNLESVLVDTGGHLIPFFVNNSSLNGQFLKVKFEDVDTEEQAEALIKKGLYLPLAALPPLSGKEFYFHEIIGFNVIDSTHGGSIGVIQSVNDSSAQTILEIEKGGTQILVPAIDEFIDSIDREAKQINITTPEGLLDIYFE